MRARERESESETRVIHRVMTFEVGMFWSPITEASKALTWEGTITVGEV